MPRPEVFVEVSVGGFDESFGVRLGVKNREHGRAGARHEGCSSVAAFEEPVLELG